MWKYNGKNRPDFAETPGPGQESVWDYPRPPQLLTSDELVDVSQDYIPVASSRSALRVLETASPPTYYLPSADINWSLLVPTQHSSFCEWKGRASYFTLASDPRSVPVAWRYEDPSERFAALHEHVSFYPALIECFVNGERVQPQPGSFYGGWITRRVVGPFKGAPGTGHW